MENIHANCADHNTRKENPTAIIIGPHRVQGSWCDVLTMAMADFRIVRDGDAVRCIKLYLCADEISWGTA